MRLAQHTKVKAQCWTVETRCIKLMSRTMTLWERIIENSIGEIVELGNIQFQFGFRRGMSTTEAIFALRIFYLLRFT